MATKPENLNSRLEIEMANTTNDAEVRPMRGTPAEPVPEPVEVPEALRDEMNDLTDKVGDQVSLMTGRAERYIERAMYYGNRAEANPARAAKYIGDSARFAAWSEGTDAWRDLLEVALSKFPG